MSDCEFKATVNLAVSLARRVVATSRSGLGVVKLH